jgi:hypothetical protein
VRDVVSGEDKPQVRTRNTPAVPAAVRDLIRSALKLAGYANTATGRRAHTERPRVLTLYDNHLIKPDDPGKRQGPAPIPEPAPPVFSGWIPVYRKSISLIAIDGPD